MLQVREASGLRRSFDAAGFITELTIGDPDDPIPALLAVRDTHGNREDLIAMKLFAGGPQDLADARAALQLDQETLDMELLRRLSARFSRSAGRALEALLAEQG